MVGPLFGGQSFGTRANKETGWPGGRLIEQDLQLSLSHLGNQLACT